MQTSTTLVSFASAALFLIVSCLAENLQQPPAGALLVQQSPGGDASSGDNEKRSSWNNLHTSWGKRYPIDDIIAARVLSNARDGLNDIDREALNDLLVNELLEASRLDEELDELYRPVAAAAEKRAWKNMNGAWGKRVSGGDWNKFRGSWGKREPAWNNLKGLWGKRDNWNKLSSAWGKRDFSSENVNY